MRGIIIHHGYSLTQRRFILFFNLSNNFFTAGDEFLNDERHCILGLHDNAEVTVLIGIERFCDDISFHSVKNELRQYAVAQAVADD